jgi:hypothetical protein
MPRVKSFSCAPSRRLARSAGAPRLHAIAIAPRAQASPRRDAIQRGRRFLVEPLAARGKRRARCARFVGGFVPAQRA